MNEHASPFLVRRVDADAAILLYKYSLVLCHSRRRGICNHLAEARETDHPSPLHTELQLPGRHTHVSQFETLLTVPVRNSFHSFVWTAHGSLAVITVQRTVDRNVLLGLNANLLHCLLI